MLVIADSSPLIVLLNIGKLDVLPGLFGEVLIPPAVADELRSPKRPQEIQTFAAAPPTWLIERAPVIVEPIERLHSGELAAISLAIELRADLLLIDEALGRQAAALRQIRFTGTIGVLELAADKGLLDLADAFERVKQTDFWISPDLLDERLRLWRSRQAPR